MWLEEKELLGVEDDDEEQEQEEEDWSGALECL